MLDMPVNQEGSSGHRYALWARGIDMPGAQIGNKQHSGNARSMVWLAGLETHVVLNAFLGWNTAGEFLLKLNRWPGEMIS